MISSSPSGDLPSHSAVPQGWRLECSYADLPAVFYQKIEPTPVKEPRLVMFNRALADELGLDGELLDGEGGAAIFSGNRLPEGSMPIAQAYAGHQFGGFNALGDGRAILLGEQITPSGERLDAQLKGSGQTPYSRRGDGRAALGPMLREYIMSEAMHALGIPTTRSLAVVSTGEKVFRQEGMIAGAVLTRIAASHIRVGTFQWANAASDEASVRALMEYTIARHFPELSGVEDPALSLLITVMDRQAALIAQWMLVGFIHGVLNTDNVALSGETIDYGPCAFMDAYDPATVFSSIDRNGRYAYGNQPSITQWNLARFAETLLPFLHENEDAAIDMATEVIENFGERYEFHWVAGMRRKLGFSDDESSDEQLIADLLEWMEETRADYTNTFASLAEWVDREPEPVDEKFSGWLVRWRKRLAGREAEARDMMRSVNPAFIPRNHLVEAALAAAQVDDYGPMERLLDVLAKPFDHTRIAPEYREPDPTGGADYRTFCGT